MEIAVCSASPLGQYLAGVNVRPYDDRCHLIHDYAAVSTVELDAGADDGVSAAQLLSIARPASKKQQRRPSATGKSSLTRWRELPIRLHRRFQLLMLRRSIPALTPIHPTIREELQQAVGGPDAAFLALPTQETRLLVPLVLLRGDGSRGFGGIRRRSSLLVGTAAVALVAVVAAARENAAFYVLQSVGWTIAIAMFFLLILELSARLLLGRHVRLSLRLADSLRTFAGVLERFNTAFDNTLALVKRAELASRGYRLGDGLLPPIGRLETSSSNVGDSQDGKSEEAKHQLRCLSLRRRLRTLNDQLQERASSLLHSNEENADVKNRQNSDTSEAEDFQAPSLLLTALAKQHSRGAILLESAVHVQLIQNLARAGSSRRAGDAGCNVFGALGAQRFVIDRLIDTLNGWSNELEAWNTSTNLAALLSPALKSDTLEGWKPKLQPPSGSSDPRLKGIATQLQELRSVSETLSALVIAAQHELLSPDTATESLVTSHDAMSSLIQQLHAVWGSYDTTLQSLTTEVATQATDIARNDDSDHESQSTTVELPSSSAPAPQDVDCTVIFTGTSTGDEGFDLQTLLNQQEANIAAASSASKPSFVRELRDVLAYRQAHTRPGLMKQVDHDPPTSLLPPVIGNTPSLPAIDSLFPLPHAPPRRRPCRAPPGSTPPFASRELINQEVGAFNVELQALLQQSLPVQGNVFESLRDSVSDNESETPADSETGSK